MSFAGVAVLTRAKGKLALRSARRKLEWRHKFDPDDGGRWSSGGGGGGATTATAAPSERSARALASHKSSTAAKQRAGDRQQRLVARGLGAEPTPDNEPVDIVTTDAQGRTVGIEVKTFCDQTNDKATMHPESLARKESWARRERARLVTVVVDQRDRFGHADRYSGTRYYVRQGAGSFRLAGMTGFNSLPEATAFITGRVR